MIMTHCAKGGVENRTPFEGKNNLVYREVVDVLAERVQGKVSPDLIQAFVLLSVPYALGYIKKTKNKSQFFLYAMKLLGTRMGKAEKGCARILFTALGKSGSKHYTERFEELEKQEGIAELIVQVILNFDQTILSTSEMNCC